MILKEDKVLIREFREDDVDNKVKWINDERNNKYLHYELPLEKEKTLVWYRNKSDNRLDLVIEYENIPVGLIGLLNIDQKNRKAEFYICIGEESARGCGIAKKASMLLLEYAFDELCLNKVYLCTEQENVSAQKLFEKLGFKKEGLIEHDLIYNERFVNRYVYGLLQEAYRNECTDTNK